MKSDKYHSYLPYYSHWFQDGSFDGNVKVNASRTAIVAHALLFSNSSLTVRFPTRCKGAARVENCAILVTQRLQVED